MFARARDFTFDIFRRIGRRIFHHDSSEDKRKKSRHSDAEMPIENIKGDEEEASVTRSGDAEKHTKEVEKVVVTSVPDSQTKEEDDSEAEYKEVSVPELIEGNTDAIHMSEEIKLEQSAEVPELESTTAIFDQEPPSTADVVESKEQEEKRNFKEVAPAILETEIDKGFKEIVAETVMPIDMVESVVPEPDSVAPELSDLKVETSEEPVTSELEALIESASTFEPASQVTMEGSSEIKPEEVVESDVQVTENVATALGETNSAKLVKSEIGQEDELLSTPELQEEEEKASDERCETRESMETNEALLQVQGQKAETVNEVWELLKPKEMDKTQPGESEARATEEHLEVVDESKSLITAKANVEISEDTEGVPTEAIDIRVEESQSEQTKEAVQSQEIQSVKDVPEVIPDEEVEESTDEPVEQMITAEFVNVVDQGIPKGDEKVITEESPKVEEKNEDIEPIKDKEEFGESSLEAKPSPSQEDEANDPKQEEAAELQQESFTISEFKTIKVDKKPEEVIEEINEHQVSSQSKQEEVSEIQQELEKSSQEVIGEVQHEFAEQSHKEGIESETKLYEVSSGSEKHGDSEPIQEEVVGAQKESEDTEAKVTEDFGEAKYQQVESSLNHGKTDEIQHGFKGQSHEESPVPEADELLISSEKAKEEKSGPAQEDTDENHEEIGFPHKESVENKVEERVEGQGESICSETEEMRICEKTLIEADNGRESENGSAEKELQESSESRKEEKADDVQEEADTGSNNESEENPTPTEEGTEEEGSEQRDEVKPHRKRRRRHGRNRNGKGKH